jgi:signal transduction histidine kinase
VRLSRLPLRGRLVAGFVGAMLVVLVAAGAFVFWRVQYALDHRLDQDLASQTSDLRQAARHAAPAAAVASLRDQGRDAQLLSADGAVLASGPGVPAGHRLLTPAQARRALRGEVQTGRGYLFSPRGRHLRILAAPVAGPGPAAVAVTAVRLDQRDEALRELLAQLAIANFLALALASFVGYRLARAALDPVERYRIQAERITHGAAGVRLDVPQGPSDEVTRLGTTLNAMLDTQERAAQRQQQFIDDASHELRTPMSTLAAEIDLALRKPRTTDEYEATLRRLAIDTTQLIDLAEDLLRLGALGSTTHDARQLPAQEVLDAGARRARSQLSTGDRRVLVVCEPADLTVVADPELLQRALGNLVDNAVRYGAGDMTLSGRRVVDPVAAVVLTVHDDGPGIPGDFLPHAAERFRQHATSRAGPGAGLGLALVDAIATAHHGQLRICSLGRHHRRPAAEPGLERIVCTHPANGTSVSFVVPATDRSTPAAVALRLRAAEEVEDEDDQQDDDEDADDPVTGEGEGHG